MREVDGQMNQNDPYHFSEFPVLETDRLLLRGPVLSDAADIFVFRSDAYVQRFNAKPMVAVSKAEELVEKNRSMFDRQDGILWAVTMNGEDRVIGLVGFSAWSYSNRAMAGCRLVAKCLMLVVGRAFRWSDSW